MSRESKSVESAEYLSKNRIGEGEVDTSSMSLRRLGRRWQSASEPTSQADEETKVKELRTALGVLSERSSQYATDACLRRYLRARNWNLKKAEKMLRESLEWREAYKPQEISWEDVAKESETGKVYRASVVDKKGHTVLVMRPANQNTSSRDGQIKQLVYSMENAILNLPQGQEEMMWFIDFKNWNMSKAISVKTTQETAHILQNHYPERLGIAILYNPPLIFETFWQIVKPFMDSRTAKKVKFVYKNDPASMKLLDEYFDSGSVDAILNEDDFNLDEYAQKMRQDDMRAATRRKFVDEEHTFFSSRTDWSEEQIASIVHSVEA